MIELGILGLEPRDARQAAVLRRWMTAFVLPTFVGRTLPVDKPVALRCAALHVPNPRPPNEALIAAAALVHGLIVVTRNTADFLPMGVPFLNPRSA